MRVPDWLKLAADRPHDPRLRRLTARQLLEARREALELAADRSELALCSNACLVARAAADRRGRPLYRSGREVLDRLTPARIEALAKGWNYRRKVDDPGLDLGRRRLDALKKAWSTRRGSAFAGACSGPLGRCRRRTGPGK